MNIEIADAASISLEQVAWCNCKRSSITLGRHILSQTITLEHTPTCSCTPHASCIENTSSKLADNFCYSFLPASAIDTFIFPKIHMHTKMPKLIRCTQTHTHIYMHTHKKITSKKKKKKSGGYRSCDMPINFIN